MAESLADFFSANFHRHRGERAYGQRRGYRMEWWSYEKVLETGFRFAYELDARGIGKGDRVVLWGGNCAEWVAAFFGCALNGVIVVPIDNGAAADFANAVSRQVDVAQFQRCESPVTRAGKDRRRQQGPIPSLGYGFCGH